MALFSWYINMLDTTIEVCEACGENPTSIDLGDVDHPLHNIIERFCSCCAFSYAEMLDECDLKAFLQEWYLDANLQLQM